MLDKSLELPGASLRTTTTFALERTALWPIAPAMRPSSTPSTGWSTSESASLSADSLATLIIHGTPRPSRTPPTIKRPLGWQTRRRATPRRHGRSRQNQSSIIVLTSDHGEGLGEHGEETHGFFVCDWHDPRSLMVWVGDDVSTRGPTTAKSVSGPASILDIATTMLTASGLAPIGSESIDLLSVDVIPSRSLSVETVTPALDFGAAPIFGVYDGSKRVWYDTPRRERYHLDSDPKQLVNRYRPEHASKADAIFGRFPRKWPPTDDPMALSPEDREALEALGYITRSVAPTAGSTIDAKDMVELFNLLTNTPDEAPLTLVSRADKMIDTHGVVPALMLFKADLLDALARPVDALQTVKDAATAHPSDRDLNGEYLQRRRALEELGRLATAIEDELANNPDDLTAQRDLALTYHRLQRFEDAERLYQRILRARPREDDVRVDMARMYASQQRYDVALGSLAPAMRRPNRSPAIDCMAGQLRSEDWGEMLRLRCCSSGALSDLRGRASRGLAQTKRARRLASQC